MRRSRSPARLIVPGAGRSSPSIAPFGRARSAKPARSWRWPARRRSSPIGCGRSYGDVALNPGGAIIDCRGLDRFIDFDWQSGVLTCEAGVRLAISYKLLVGGGTNGKFTDAWKQLHPTDPGYTCCQAANLQNPVSHLGQRIDLVLYRGPIQAVEASLAGKSPDRSHADDAAIVAVRSCRARSNARRRSRALTEVVITTAGYLQVRGAR